MRQTRYHSEYYVNYDFAQRLIPLGRVIRPHEKRVMTRGSVIGS
jgi:hypothetical protein